MEKGKPQEQPNNPLHGVKLATILDVLTTEYSWEELYEMVNINCFKSNPSIKSSLKFLRRTPWARERVEGIYLKSLRIKKKGPLQKKKPLNSEKKPPLQSYGSKPSYLD